MSFGQRQRKEALELASKLLTAFAWEDTAEGKEYWNQVFKNLNKIAQSVETCSKCGQPIPNQ